MALQLEHPPGHVHRPAGVIPESDKLLRCGGGAERSAHVRPDGGVSAQVVQPLACQRHVPRKVDGVVGGEVRQDLEQELVRQVQQSGRHRFARFGRKTARAVLLAPYTVYLSCT